MSEKKFKKDIIEKIFNLFKSIDTEEEYEHLMTSIKYLLISISILWKLDNKKWKKAPKSEHDSLYR